MDIFKWNYGEEVQTCIPRGHWAQRCSGLTMLSVILDRIPGSETSKRCSTLAYLTQS